jgi:hypothetical protein
MNLLKPHYGWTVYVNGRRFDTHTSRREALVAVDDILGGGPRRSAPMDWAIIKCAIIPIDDPIANMTHDAIDDPSTEPPATP